MPDELDSAALVLCDPFFTVKRGLGRDRKGHPIVQPGQLVFAHQTRPPEIDPYIVEIHGYDPRDSSNNSYVVSRYTDGPRTHFPIKELSLHADENLYILYGKMRPAIVLQVVEADFYNRNNPERYAVLAPCFTFKPKHAAEYRARVAAFEFPNLFFLPAQPGGFSGQTVARFEHIQAVAGAGVRPVMRNGTNQCFLSAESWAILQHQLSLFLVGKNLDDEMAQEIKSYRECVMESYRESASGATAGG